MLWKNRKYYSEKLLSLNSNVMDDSYNTYETANIENIQLFVSERLISYLIFRTSSYL
jgi:hypothetical protein